MPVGQTDKQTDGHQTIAFRFPLDAAQRNKWDMSKYGAQPRSRGSPAPAAAAAPKSSALQIADWSFPYASLYLCGIDCPIHFVHRADPIIILLPVYLSSHVGSPFSVDSPLWSSITPPPTVYDCDLIFYANQFLLRDCACYSRTR